MTPLAGLLVDVPAREPARELVRAELRDPAYEQARPPALLDLLGRALRRLTDLVEGAAGGIDQGPLAAVVLVAVLLLVVLVVLVRVGPRRAGPGQQAPLFEGAQLLSAAEHRALAEQALARGAFDDAIRERLRATVRELEDRGVLEPRPGRTAGEIAQEAGQAAPALAGPMTGAARRFDEVWYGGRPGDADGYQVVVDADGAVRAARLVAP